jgi:hypothetical protein
LLVAATWVIRLRYVFFGLCFALSAWLVIARVASGPTDQLDVEIARLEALREAHRKTLARQATKEGLLPLDFSHLDFQLPPEASGSADPTHGYGRWVPAEIKGYDGRNISIEGFMLPTKMRDSDVEEFMVLPNQFSCCFGQPPTFCGFIAARVVAKPLICQTDQPLVFKGRLHVRDVFSEGSWVALYTLDCVAAVPSDARGSTAF